MNKNILCVAAITTIISAGTAYETSAQENLNDNQVVRTTFGNVVHSLGSNTCVRTRWETADGIDPCAPKVEKVEVVQYQPPSPARQLKRADKTVTFDFDSAELDEAAKQKLDNLANVLRQSTDVRHANIVGFADRIGNAAYNKRLSQRRAESVKDYLAGRGYLNARVVETRGLGETHSVTDCTSKESRKALIDCLQPDRRVEAEIVFTEKVDQTSYRQPQTQNQQQMNRQNQTNPQNQTNRQQTPYRQPINPSTSY